MNTPSEASAEPDDDELIYVCQSCGYEGHPDEFGQFCPKCGTDLDELEGEAT